MFTGITSFFVTAAGKIVAGIVTALLIASVGAYAGYRFEAGRLSALQAAAAQSVAEAAIKAGASQKAQDAISMAAAVAEAKAQDAQTAKTQMIVKEIPHYVTRTIERRIPCIPYGLVRLLDAAALQADPATLGYAAGQSDDACAPVDAAALAESVVKNYGAAEANAEQLNTLEAWIVANHQAQESVK